MVKYGYKETAECTLCKKANEESGSSWNRELPEETIGHIQSAGLLRTEGWGTKSKGGRESGQGSGTRQVGHVCVKSACGPKLND